MVGILVLIALSWVILYLVEKKSIMALGIRPVTLRIKQLLFGFITTSLLCIGTELLEMALGGSLLRVSEGFIFSQFVKMLWWDIRSVVTEELIFRGALLYILIRRLGLTAGLLISSVAFGAYHWFTMGILGNIVPMVVIFVGTGLMGYAWALAFAKTRSIVMPIGFHLGWNFTLNTIFSGGPLGNGLLLTEGGKPISDFYSLVGLWLVPVIVLLVVKYGVSKEPDDTEKILAGDVL